MEACVNDDTKNRAVLRSGTIVTNRRPWTALTRKQASAKIFIYHINCCYLDFLKAHKNILVRRVLACHEQSLQKNLIRRKKVTNDEFLKSCLARVLKSDRVEVVHGGAKI